MRGKRADVPRGFSMDFLSQAMSAVKPGKCFVCGDSTTEQFFGVWLCEPYADDGTVVKRCKWIYRDGDR